MSHQHAHPSAQMCVPQLSAVCTMTVRAVKHSQLYSTGLIDGGSQAAAPHYALLPSTMVDDVRDVQVCVGPHPTGPAQRPVYGGPAQRSPASNPPGFICMVAKPHTTSARLRLFMSWQAGCSRGVQRWKTFRGAMLYSAWPELRTRCARDHSTTPSWYPLSCCSRPGCSNS